MYKKNSIIRYIRFPWPSFVCARTIIQQSQSNTASLESAARKMHLPTPASPTTILNNMRGKIHD